MWVKGGIDLEVWIGMSICPVDPWEQKHYNIELRKVIDHDGCLSIKKKYLELFHADDPERYKMVAIFFILFKFSPASGKVVVSYISLQ